MVEIECHVCGKNFNLPQCIDTNNYDGEVVCPGCKSLLHVKLVKEKLQKRKVVSKGKIEWTADDYEMAARLLAKDKKEERQLIEKHAPKLPASMDDKPPKASSPKG